MLLAYTQLKYRHRLKHLLDLMHVTFRCKQRRDSNANASV